MRKILFFMILAFMTALIPAGAGQAAEPSSPRIILYTVYLQFGEDDRVQVGSVDEEGVIRTLSGNHADMNWPGRPEEQLEYLSVTEKFITTGTMSSGELFAVKSLISCTEDQGNKSVSMAEDAGTEESYAVRYSKEGVPSFILLGISGESVFENTDPDAQALYLRLRRLFPDIISYAYDIPQMGPQGFAPVPLTDLTGLDFEAVMNAEIKDIYNDCEEGPIPMEMTEETKTELLDLIRSGIVTGKADCLVSTGGSHTYSFFDRDGSPVGMIELEDGLLVTNDGHYYIGIP